MQAPYRSLILSSLTLILSHLTFHKLSKQYLRSIKEKKKMQRYGFVAIFTRSLVDFTFYAEISRRICCLGFQPNGRKFYTRLLPTMNRVETDDKSAVLLINYFGSGLGFCVG